MKKVKSLLALLLAMLIAFGGTVCAFAATLEETEDNGEIATADVMTLGSSIKGKIGDADDVDYYTFTAAESGLVTVTLAHDKKTDADAVASYFEVTVLDSKGDVIDSFKSAGSDASVSIDFSAAPSAYYVKVNWDKVLDDSLEYTLSASINKTALFEKEPNNTASQATEMTLSKKGDNKLYYGAITEGDVDYYLVTFSKPSLALFGIYNTTSKSGSYKASLIKIVDGLDGKPAEKVVGTITIDDEMKVKDSPLFGVNGGTYYLKVEGADSSSTGGYQVRVYAGDSNSTDEYEYNNEEKYANLITTTRTYTGNIFDESDVDMYKFEAANGNHGFEITLVDYDSKKDVTNGQWTVEITDENGNIVEEKVTVLNSEKAVVKTDVLNKGTYYIKVAAGNVFTGETYKISLAAGKATEPDDKDDGITTFDEFFADLKAIDWSGFWRNFEGWFEYINVIGIVKDLMASVMDFITTFVFANM